MNALLVPNNRTIKWHTAKAENPRPSLSQMRTDTRPPSGAAQLRHTGKTWAKFRANRGNGAGRVADERSRDFTSFASHLHVGILVYSEVYYIQLIQKINTMEMKLSNDTSRNTKKCNINK